ncbi:MauE/DoxX family redox-associated membrane protein [Ornithinimicrobium sufpigmenti]|uniref:MauE/DoxX family redox-associated membrane protein n=1 Tax=Ornithinimicrobium sufpigmenti TaxID=2508882 RepID=UPI001EDF25C5|nr:MULTISPECIES: MauE/DoxX family redox-associated membrane protein [unclassified Ornithinimicrobium]
MTHDADLRTDPADAGAEPVRGGGEAAYRSRSGMVGKLGKVGWVTMAGLLARVGLGVVLIAAGLPKLMDVTGSVQNVMAYELFDYGTARFIGTMLPVVEIVLGVLLVLGLFTRAAAAAGGLLMIVFIAGIASAWARGLTIDCGCFGSGGPVEPGETTYLLDILRDLLFLAMAAWLVVRPRTPLALDTLITKGR